MFVGKKIGPFLVDKELGSGAMGAVYRGRHADSGDHVAIKVIAPGLCANANALKRFQRETSILKQLSHPNIVRLLASGKVEGTPFYVMDFVDGESLDRVMERRGRLSWEEVIPLGQQLCAALQHAHDKGIIHRDLKPGNLMVLGDGSVKLTDFGIAKDIDVTALTAANSTVGTCAYMSPEQCRGSVDISPKADLYSMGVMFFELITGRKPFLAETVMDMFMQHTQGKFPRPSRLVMDLPVWFDNLICQLLAKKPDDRPFSAEKVAESLAKVREQHETQQSAAVTAVRKRRADRTVNDVALDEKDKELARTLLGKRKKKSDPFYRQNWFTISSVAGVLLCLMVAVYFVFLKAPGPDALYAEAETMIEQQQMEEARTGPLASFLRYYPDHPKTDKVRELSDRILRDERLRQMKNRRRADFALDPDPARAAAERMFRQALDEEDAGKLPEAEKRWVTLLKHKDDQDEEMRAWSLIAQKYLDELRGIETMLNDLKSKIGSEKGTAGIGNTEAEKLALDALRFESEEKWDEARRKWDDLKDLTRQRDDQRRWYLLAARCRRDVDQTTRKKPEPGAD